MRISVSESASLHGNNLLAAFGIAGRVRVKVVEEGRDYYAVVPDGKIAIPSPHRWRFYKRGWNARLARLSYQFGVGEIIQLGQGNRVIDVGANVGEFSLAVARMGAISYAIEGDPLVFECLERNVAGVDSIHSLQEVLWREEGELTFYSQPQGANSSIFQPPTRYESTAFRVSATTLDRLAERLNLDGVDLLKCDAEGAEPEVIEGGMDLLGRTRQVAIDTGPERLGERTDETCAKLLEKIGFRVIQSGVGRRKVTFGVRDT